MAKMKNSRIGRKKAQLERRWAALALSGIERCVQCGAPGEIGAPFLLTGWYTRSGYVPAFHGRAVPAVFSVNPPHTGYFAFCGKCDTWSGSVPLSTLTPYIRDGKDKWFPLDRESSP